MSRIVVVQLFEEFIDQNFIEIDLTNDVLDLFHFHASIDTHQFDHLANDLHGIFQVGHEGICLSNLKEEISDLVICQSCNHGDESLLEVDYLLIDFFVLL